MSDPEDLQTGNKHREDWLYQLRRIGPPATCAKIPDIMRLKKGLTRIGRGQHNDFFLDSAVLKNFISRSHVEIVGNQNENGEIEFILTDKGLNGTFINDIRTHKTCTLEVGNKITFGHTNGYKIQPGSYAEQPLSEFQFQFERIPRISKTSEMFSDSRTTNTSSFDESKEIKSDLKNDTTIVSDRLFLSDIQSNVVKSPEKCAKPKITRKGRNRGDSSSQSDNEPDFLKESSSPKSSSDSGIPNVESSNRPSSSDSVPGKSRRNSNKDILSDEVPDPPPELDEENDVTAEEEQDTQKKKRGKKKGRIGAAKKTQGKKKSVDPQPSDTEESSEDDSSKPEADQRPRTQIVSKQKPPKRRKAGNDAPAIGSRKRRRKGGPSSTAAAASTSDDLEPGVEWYEDDTCDSADCKRPKKKRTPWVQCDDCDGWYHTVCVGANYNKLKDSDEHFNCGCE